MNTYVYIECYLLNADWSEECSRHYIVVQYNKTHVMCNVRFCLKILDSVTKCTPLLCHAYSSELIWSSIADRCVGYHTCVLV